MKKSIVLFKSLSGLGFGFGLVLVLVFIMVLVLSWSKSCLWSGLGFGYGIGLGFDPKYVFNTLLVVVYQPSQANSTKQDKTNIFIVDFLTNKKYNSLRLL